MNFLSLILNLVGASLMLWLMLWYFMKQDKEINNALDKKLSVLKEEGLIPL